MNSREEDLRVEDKEEKLEKKEKKVAQVPGDIVIKPGVRRTSRSTAGRKRVQEDEIMEDDYEKAIDSPKSKGAEEVTKKVSLYIFGLNSIHIFRKMMPSYCLIDLTFYRKVIFLLINKYLIGYGYTL